MAKILVADDNSNVQKTMALALADLGVELVSVNNGEAAVRKLADFSPDLVLADIFMPVRNGYEVCEYVKKDPRFAHVPVVLLVGAFDPLDEREAQRVGADGVLKKPFVPPDPLITMVKALLERSMSERLVTAAVSKTAAPAKTSTKVATEVPAPVSPVLEEPSPEEFPVAPIRVSFGEGDRPVAFGQLLETPTLENAPIEAVVMEPVDSDQILTSSRDASLGAPIFGHNQPSEAESAALHPADIQDEPLELVREQQEETAPSVREEESLPQQAGADLLTPDEPLELVREQQEETAPSVVDSEPVLLDAASQASLTVESGTVPELAANPLEWMATAPPQLSDYPSEAESGSEQPIAGAAKAVDAVEPTSQSALKTVTEFSQDPEDTVQSDPTNEWTEMTESLKATATELAAQQIASMSEPPARVPAPAISKAAAVMPPRAPASGSPAPDPALVEAVVQRVLDKMRPQVIDIITKEFLRPVVQALVHREIEKH